MRSGGWLFPTVAALLVAGGARLGYIVQTQGEELREFAQRQSTAQLTIPAQRGDILDARGRVLVGTIRRPSIYVDPSSIIDPRFAAYSIAPVLGLDAAELEKTIRERRERGFVWVKREVTDGELHAFSQVRRARGLHSFGVQYEPMRDYPYGTLAAQTLGFVGAEQHGLAGVEQACDAYLIGEDGYRRSTVDVRRRRLSSQPDDYRAPRDGSSVVLTLDAHIQQRVEYHLANAVEQFKAQWGTAVVLDPATGELLAIATAPSFDPAAPIPEGLSEAQREAALERTRNRAIADSYEPGSIYKPYIASLAFDAGLARLDERFTINGPTRQFGPRIIHDTHVYDVLDLRGVISKSSNIGMGMLGARLGNERLNEFVRRFGFGEVTGVSLPGEHSGLVQAFSRWNSYSTQSIPIGQEIAVTPVQVVAAFAAFCNGGVLLRPRIVRGVIDARGEILHDFSAPIPVRQVMKPESAERFRREALAEVVKSGTGQKAAIADYQVFGKTGTAQVARSNGRGYIPNAYVGSFVGGAPLNQPRAVAVVSLFRPSGGKYYGGTVAAPACGAMLADVLAYLRAAPEIIETPKTPRPMGDGADAE